jgi:hypothetical protein
MILRVGEGICAYKISKGMAGGGNIVGPDEEGGL